MMPLSRKAPPFTHSTAFTLAVGYVVLGLLAMALFAFPLWYWWRVIYRDSQMETLHEETQRMTQIYQEFGLERLEAFLTERARLRIVGDRIVLLATPSLQPIAGNLPAWPAGVPDQPGSYIQTIQMPDGPLMVMLVRTRLPSGQNLLIGRDVSHSGKVEHRFWIGLAGSSGALLALGLCGAVLVRREVLSKLNAFSQSITTIAGGDLSHRLPVSGRHSEFDALARTINGMFDQIEQLLNGVRNVSNAVAHDLRTPLTQLRARLERLAARIEVPSEALAEIDGAVEDVDSVIHMFNALLRLAEIDGGARRCGFVSINLVDVALGAIEFYQPVAEIKAISLSFHGAEGGVWLQGDSLLLIQALANLIDNALKFVPSGGAVTVTVEKRFDDGALITVADDGPGIPADERLRVVERFYRLDASREQTTGVGLGLSLVDAVAKLHGGALQLMDNEPGLRVQLALGADPYQPAG